MGEATHKLNYQDCWQMKMQSYNNVLEVEKECPFYLMPITPGTCAR